MMISDIFFEGKLKDEKFNIIYSEDFVEYKIASFIYTKKGMSEDEIFNCLLTVYNKKFLKRSSILGVLEQSFTKLCKKYFSLYDDQNDSIFKASEAMKYFDSYFNFSEEKLYSVLNQYIGNEKFNTSIAIMCMAVLQYKNKYIESEDHVRYIFYKISKLQKNSYENINKKISGIDSFYDKLLISNILDNKVQLNVFFASNINTVYDLKQLPVESLICVFSVDLERFINTIDTLHLTFNDFIINKIESHYSVISEKEFLIINKRFTYSEHEKRSTLEAISLIMGITRERVRQIEARTLEKIMLERDGVENVAFCLYEILVKEGEKYFDVDRLIKYLNNDEHAKYILLFLEVGKLKVRYDDRYRVIYNSEVISIEEILNNEIENMGYIFVSDKINLLNSFQRKILISEYREYQNGIFLKRGILDRFLYTSLIKEIFKNGYPIGDSISYNLFLNEIKNRYGDIDNIPSPRSLRAMIERSDFILVDRGIYLSSDMCVQLSEELLDKITEYIFNNKPTVFYRTIFEEFKEELQEYIVSIDREKYNIITDAFREADFKSTMKEVKENKGKIFLARDNDKIIGFIVGIIVEASDTYDFKAPKGGKISELVVTRNCRAKGVGQALLNKMEDYLKSVGCKRVLIEVFEYNDLAKNFYYKNGYFNRVTDVMKKI